MEYTITTDDIEAYLATKQDDDEIGIACHAQKCLITNAVRMKYPQAEMVSTAMARVIIDEEQIQLSSELHYLYNRFDMLCDLSVTEDKAVTKREWLEAREVAR